MPEKTREHDRRLKAVVSLVLDACAEHVVWTQALHAVYRWYGRVSRNQVSPAGAAWIQSRFGMPQDAEVYPRKGWRRRSADEVIEQWLGDAIHEVASDLLRLASAWGEFVYGARTPTRPVVFLGGTRFSHPPRSAPRRELVLFVQLTVSVIGSCPRRFGGVAWQSAKTDRAPARRTQAHNL